MICINMYQPIENVYLAILNCCI